MERLWGMCIRSAGNWRGLAISDEPEVAKELRAAMLRTEQPRISRIKQMHKGKVKQPEMSTDDTDRN